MRTVDYRVGPAFNADAPALPHPLARIGTWAFAHRYHVLITLTWVLSAFDGLMSLYFFKHGLAVEANPLMNVLLQAGPGAFFAGKCMIVTAGLAVLYRYRSRLLARVGCGIVSMAYSLLACWHLYGLAIS